MAYVPGYRYDLFVSYAAENNREGWIEQFEGALGDEMAELLGRQFNRKESIFFDKRELQIGSFPDQLAAAARDSAILIPVLSPGYLTSQWCASEREAFFKSPEGEQSGHPARFGAPDVSPQRRLAPIVIKPFEEADLDELYHNAQRVSFLSRDGQTPFAAGSSEWLVQLRKFAGQLKNALTQLRNDCKPLFIGKAAAAERLQNLRTWCCREVETRHFRTVPSSLPIFEDRDAVRIRLQEAGLALHFLGGADPAALDAMEASVEVCKGPSIFYQPFGADLRPEERLWLLTFEQQQEATRQSTSGSYQRLVGKNEQELLALIDEQITRSRADSNSNHIERYELAIVCEESDLEGARRLKSEIGDRHIEVGFPDFLGTRLKAMECLRKLQEFLKRGKHLLFYHGLAQRELLETKCLVAEQYHPRAELHYFLAPLTSCKIVILSRRRRIPKNFTSRLQFQGILSFMFFASVGSLLKNIECNYET